MKQSPGLNIPSFTKRDYHEVGFFPSDQLVEAVNAAILLKRPLLLTGEPGSGKTRVAEVVAELIVRWCSHNLPRRDIHGEILERFHVKSESRSSHLLYRYDAQRRFADSHIPSRIDKTDNVGNYLETEPLGRALLQPGPTVFLCDEIDKAPKDFCNDLLDVILERRFDILEVPVGETYQHERWEGYSIARKMKRKEVRLDASVLDWSPVIVITSNSERLLPTPFLRRTLFCHMDFPSDTELKRILEHKFKDFKAANEAIRLLTTLRDRTPELKKKPCTAELEDFVTLCIKGKKVDEMKSAADRLKKGKGEETELWKAVPFLGSLVKVAQDMEKLIGIQEY